MKLTSKYYLFKVLKDILSASEENTKVSLKRVIALFSFISILFAFYCNILAQILVQKIYIYMFLSLILISFGIINSTNIVDIITSLRKGSNIDSTLINDEKDKK